MGGEGEGAVRIPVRRGRVGVERVEEGRRQRWEELMEDWKALRGEDEVTRLKAELEGERLRRERAEAEVAQWTELSKELYGISVRQAMKRMRATVEGKGEEEQQGRLVEQTTVAAAVEGNGDEGAEEEEEEEKMRAMEEADGLAEPLIDVADVHSEDGSAEKRQRSLTSDSGGAV